MLTTTTTTTIRATAAAAVAATTTTTTTTRRTASQYLCYTTARTTTTSSFFGLGGGGGIIGSNNNKGVFGVGGVVVTSSSSSSSSFLSSSLDDGMKKMKMSSMPTIKPSNPEFSSGPCKKRPGYDISKLDLRILGRSHRSKIGKERLLYAITKSKSLLGIPQDYKLGIVPASDTGAYEMALWNVLGKRNVDVCYWESFGKGWYNDVISHLKLRDLVEVNEYTSEYGELPDLSKVDSINNDVCFTFNGTTSGVRVPKTNVCEFISDERNGLSICDATSAVFAMDIPWNKLDIITYSWQKVLGGEGGHGVLILSPRAIERLESYTPLNRPLPKIFRLVKKGTLDEAIFQGATINTPSMIAVEDYIDALEWTESIGGLSKLIEISEANLSVIENFVKQNQSWINFLAKDRNIRSSTSVCLTLNLNSKQIKYMVKLLEDENVAFDIGGYRDAPPSIRIWCGGTVETHDVELLMPWLKWAYEEAKKMEQT